MEYNERMEPEIIQKQIEDLKNKTQLTRRERRYLQKLENKLSRNQNPSKPFNFTSAPLSASAQGKPLNT